MKLNQIKPLLTLLLLVACSSMAMSQNEISYSENLYGEIYFHPNGLDGSPYLNDTWNIGLVNLKNGKTVANVRMKFNILTNNLIFYNDQFKQLFLADKNTTDAFIMNSGQPDSMYFIKYEGNNLSYRLQKNDFVEVLQSGKISLWAKHSADISSSNDISNRDKIFPKNYYFISTATGIFEIKLKVKSIIELFPDRKQEIKKLASTHKIKNKSPKNIALLIDLMNK